MNLDARQFSEGTTLETDVCIVGAGPAGLVLAAELVGGQGDVILLESGGELPEPEILALNDGFASGDVYSGLGPTRHRGVGGTSLLWNTPVLRSTPAGNAPWAGAVGAKYAPLDAADFEVRPGVEHSGWPFGLDDMYADYDRAQQICALGPSIYDAWAWTSPGREPWSALGPDLVSRVYQLGSRDAFLAPLRASIDRATNLRLCTHATAVMLHRDSAGRRVTTVSVATPGGAPWSVRAKRVVLAGGAVENARLLLLTDDGRGALGNSGGWLGRGFMEHPRDRSITLRPRSRELYEQSGFYDLSNSSGGAQIVGRIALRDATLASGAVPNASATLIPKLRRAVRLAHTALPSFAARWLATEGHGWSRTRGAAAWFDGFTVLLNLEQSPHPENRVTLSAHRDSLGVPLPALHWEWRADDQRRLARLRAIVSIELHAVGAVTVDTTVRVDPNAHHHAGTTRMHDDPTRGVTDRHGRVHGADNLFVAGASNFPTTGFANPVLTIVALTLRLARHLSEM
jgi:choline dehydrogenase-like flavoprotein